MKIHQAIPETIGRVATPDGMAQVMPYQIVVMVSIAASRVLELTSDSPRFPAVLDTGNNHNFAIRQEQFARWTGLTLPKRGHLFISITPCDPRAARIHYRRFSISHLGPCRAVEPDVISTRGGQVVLNPCD